MKAIKIVIVIIVLIIISVFLFFAAVIGMQVMKNDEKWRIIEERNKPESEMTLTERSQHTDYMKNVCKEVLESPNSYRSEDVYSCKQFVWTSP